MDIGKRIRTAREARGITQEELARRAGVPLNRVGRIETGAVTDPRSSTLSRIADGLGMSVAELLEEPVAAGKAEAPLAESIPQSLGELLGKRGARTRHLADENLKEVLGELPFEEALQIAGEVEAEFKAIGSDFEHLRVHFWGNPQAMRLVNEAGMRLLQVRYSLRAKRGQQFVPTELVDRFNQAMHALQEAESTLVGV